MRLHKTTWISHLLDTRCIHICCAALWSGSHRTCCVGIPICCCDTVWHARLWSGRHHKGQSENVPRPHPVGTGCCHGCFLIGDVLLACRHAWAALSSHATHNTRPYLAGQKAAAPPQEACDWSGRGAVQVCGTWCSNVRWWHTLCHSQQWPLNVVCVRFLSVCQGRTVLRPWWLPLTCHQFQIHSLGCALQWSCCPLVWAIVGPGSQSLMGHVVATVFV